jgi:selenocysteine-specific elongation factor
LRDQSSDQDFRGARISPERAGDLRGKIAALKSSAPKIDVARFKDLTGVSRKYAIPLLEYLDRERVTRRVGDERLIL